MLNENEVYQLLKPYVENLGWIVLGGEPPGGTDHIPVIELKDPANLSGGSKGSKKIDLVFFRDNNFLLLELKEIFAQSDVDKLDDIVSSDVWQKSFFNAMFEKDNFIYLSVNSRYLIIFSTKSTKYCLPLLVSFS